MDANEPEHVPVLLKAVLNLMTFEPGIRMVDATLGGGGYTRALLERIGPQGSLMAFDWDKQAIERFRERYHEDPVVQQALAENRLHLLQRPYSELSSALREVHWSGVQGIVADLGLSSLQLDDAERGLSFLVDGPLDMRLNSRETVTAADIVNHWSRESLAELFRVYGDEGEALRIAEAVVQTRKRQPLLRTMALADLVKQNVVAARRRGRIHPATKVFQALRMAVNSETEELKSLLAAIHQELLPFGKCCIVSFHSGEDGLVKRTFQEWVAQGGWQLITRKPQVPTEDEVLLNPRSRSAKLRCIQKK
ncbi:MAG: 16S rRNA (cytosine(1402)-N(4))-methyltransferase RsmH [Candidatus Moraniibacteriota bacterium]|nr:MAG: 16S rRNA (cytosine(1402)-N(4))-methyltransferase RsmH [Candidatus Moranbacteria bacterium]